MRNIIIGSVGKNSCHKQWLSHPDFKNFDLVLVSYDGVDYSKDCDQIFYLKGFKYDCVYQLFNDGHLDYTKYDTIMLLDDDLSISTHQLAKCFNIFNKYEMSLGQPSLDHRSYFSHAMCLHRPEWKIRWTNFVECMCPMFSQQTFKLVLPTFIEAPMGTAIDWVWPMLLGYPVNKIGIIDAIQIVHTRPVRGDYSVYAFSDQSYYKTIQERYNPPQWFVFTAYSAVEKD